jgi:hypothetical protein
MGVTSWVFVAGIDKKETQRLAALRFSDRIVSFSAA